MQVIVEIGVNHLGDEKIARKIIDKAKERFEKPIFKVQIRTPELCVPCYMWDKKKVINNKEMTYIEYKKKNELDWEKIFKENEKWFASCWDLPALERYLKMKGRLNWLKIPAVFAFKQEITFDLIDRAKDSITDIYVSLPVIEVGEDVVYEYVRKIKRKYVGCSVYPVLTFMSYNSKRKVNYIEMIDFRKKTNEMGFSCVGYSSHSGVYEDYVVAKHLDFFYYELHGAVAESSDSSDFASSINLECGFEDLIGGYSYADVDHNKIKSLLPEKWK